MKLNRSVYSSANMPTNVTQTASQNINYNDVEDLLEMKLNQVRRINKQQECNIKTLQSRLHHLQHQDRQCQRNISKTANEIQHLVLTKSRINDDTNYKQYFDKLKKQRYDENSCRVQSSKQERYLRNKHIEEQRQQYSETYSFLHKEYKTNISQAKIQTQNDIYTSNSKSHKLIRQNHLKQQQEKIWQQQLKQQQASQNYMQKLLQEAEMFKQNQLYLSQLEYTETNYLDTLKVTKSQSRCLSAKKDEIKKLPADKIQMNRNNLFRIN